MGPAKIVLIIEDNASLRTTLVQKLKNSNYEVYECENGKKALDKTMEINPDVILLDIMMPDMSGVEYLKRLHQSNYQKNPKVLVLTNADEIETVADMVELGVSSYVIKAETDMQEIVQQIEDALRD